MSSRAYVIRVKLLAKDGVNRHTTTHHYLILSSSERTAISRLMEDSILPPGDIITINSSNYYGEMIIPRDH